MKNTLKCLIFITVVFLFRFDAHAGKMEDNGIEHLMLVNRKILSEPTFDKHNQAKILFDSLSAIKVPKERDSVYVNLSYLIAISLYNSNKYNTTINYLLETIPLLKNQLSKTDLTVKKLINLSFLLSGSYQAVGLWDQSIDLQYKLLFDALHYKLPSEEAVIYNNIASVMYKQGDYQQASSMLLKAININEHQKDKEKLFVNYNNMSATLVKLKKYDQAIEYAFLAIHQFSNHKNREMVALVQRNIASIYLITNELSLAEKYLKKVENYQLTHQQIHYLAITYKILGDLRAKQKQYQMADIYYKKALSIKNTPLTDRIEVLRSYAQFCKEEGDINKTYALLEKYIQLKDSVSAIEDKNKFSSIATMYLEEQRLRAQESDQLQNLKNTLSAWRWSFVITFFLIFISIVYVIYRYNRQSKRKTIRINDQARQLVSLSLDVMHKEEFMSSIVEELTKLQQEFDSRNFAQRATLRNIISSILKQNHEDRDSYFENMNSNFHNALLDKYPSLTSKDLRLCVLLRLGLSTKEIADITCKETRSVESARNRLRRKCELPQDLDLFKFFNRFG